MRGFLRRAGQHGTMQDSHDPEGGDLVLFEAPDGEIRLDVRVESETVWLTQAQMATLFDRDRSVITRHLANLFRTGELEESSNVRFLHIAGSDKPVGVYSLDAVLSVGYRVNSKRGSQFRAWATRTLKAHLLRGFTLQERRLREVGSKDLEDAVALLARTLTNQDLVSDEGRAVLGVVRRYARSWRLLLAYDEQRLSTSPAQPTLPTATLNLDEARAVAKTLREELTHRGEAGALFGQERGSALAAILGAIEQTFDGVALYPSAQERAAHLLYFVIKDHPFGDGNKRLGALYFLEYMRRNGIFRRPNGSPRIADDALVALALLIAESAPAQKQLMIRLILSLLDDAND